MDSGDLVRCWSANRYRQIGIVLEHNKLLKSVRVFFHEDGKIATLYSRDVELYRRSPVNLREIRKKIEEKLDNQD